MRHSIAALAFVPGMVAAADKPAEQISYDFEGPGDLESWSNLEIPKAEEPGAKIELSTEHATSGKQNSRLTFAGGQWPKVTTEQVSQDWHRFDTFEADVTASRPCVVGFTRGISRTARALVSSITPARNIVNNYCPAAY